MHVGDSRITLFVILLIRGGGIGPTPRRRGYAEGGTDRGTRQTFRHAGPDRAPAVGDRQVEARDVRAALRAQSASDRGDATQLSRRSATPAHCLPRAELVSVLRRQQTL